MGVGCLALAWILGLLPDLVKMRGTQPRLRSRKRVEKVLAFMAGPDIDDFFRRTCLAAHLVGHVNNICGQLREGEPLLVRLCKGVVKAAVERGGAPGDRCGPGCLGGSGGRGLSRSSAALE